MTKVLALAIVITGLAYGCRNPSDPPPEPRPPVLTLPPPIDFPLPTPPPTCPQILIGDYFWDGNLHPDYPYWASGIRVFWRPGVPIVVTLPAGGRAVPVRWVVHHTYGGCGMWDAPCGEAAVRQLASVGVRYVEIANETLVECGSCLAVQRETARAARQAGLHITVNIEAYSSARREEAWRAAIAWVRDGLADRVAIHALLPSDVATLPAWLSEGPWELEISTDGQHCNDAACAHTDTGELLRALVARYGRGLAFEADLYENGRLGGGTWGPAELAELNEFVGRGCR